MAMHYIIGVSLAYFLGVKGNKKYLWGLVAVIPDIDALLFVAMAFLRNVFGMSFEVFTSSQSLVVLFAHRGFSHSILLLLLVLGGMYLFKARKQGLILVSVLWFSHLFFDYLTAWKLFLLLPFSYLSSYFGLVEVFDSFLVLFTTLIFAFFVGLV